MHVAHNKLNLRQQYPKWRIHPDSILSDQIFPVTKNTVTFQNQHTFASHLQLCQLKELKQKVQEYS